MIIGKMDKRIKLQKPNLVPDGQGGQKPATGGKFIDIDDGSVWAEFRTPQIKELVAMGTAVSEMNQLMSIHRRTDVRRGWRVVYGTRIFDIKNAFDPDKQTTLLVCKEVTK